MLKPTFEPQAWEDYLYWQDIDKKKAKKINSLIKSCQKTPFNGEGKPELLKSTLQGYWSRRIDSEHRLVYTVKDDKLIIIQCKGHY